MKSTTALSTPPPVKGLKQTHNPSMKRLLAFALLGLLFSLGACDAAFDPCGELPDSGDTFKTTGFTTEALRIESGDSLRVEPALSPIADDTLAGDSLAIRMTPTQAFYSTASKGSMPVGFVSVAYACTPKIPSSDEIIRDIQVYSDRAFDDAHPAGDDLADLFDVVAFYRAGHAGYRRLGLNAFLSEAPNAADELILVLTSAPQATSAHRFTVKYFQEGAGLDYYEFETDVVVLRAD